MDQKVINRVYAYKNKLRREDLKEQLQVIRQFRSDRL